MANNPIAIDASDLQYYDKQIKKYIDDKDAELKASLSTFDDIDKRIDNIAEKVSANEANIISHREELDDIEPQLVTINQEIADIRVNVENKLDESAMEYLATKDYVDQAILNAELNDKEVDLTNYYTKSEVDAKIPSLAGYATEDYVKAKIAEAELNDKEVDLSSYYTKTETDQVISDAIANIPAVDLSEYAKKSEIPDVSDFVTNTDLGSKGFVTEDILSENYATNEFVNESIASINEKVDQIAIPTKVSELDNDAGYSTTDYVDDKVKVVSAHISATRTATGVVIHYSDIDTTGDTYLNDGIDGKDGTIIYYSTLDTSDEVFSEETKTFTSSDFETLAPPTYQMPNLNDLIITKNSDYWRVTVKGSDYVAARLVARGKGEKGDTVDLSNYYNKAEVDSLIDGIDIPTVPTNVSAFTNDANYATEQYVLDHVNTQIETEVETQVTEVVEKQVTEVVQTQVKDEVAQQLATNTAIQYGEF